MIKKRSRNCVEFWIEKGFTKEQAEIEVKKVMNEIHDKTSKKLRENPEKWSNTLNSKTEEEKIEINRKKINV